MNIIVFYFLLDIHSSMLFHLVNYLLRLLVHASFHYLNHTLQFHHLYLYNILILLHLYQKFVFLYHNNLKHNRIFHLFH